MDFEDKLTEADIIQQCKAGNKKGFQLLVERYAPKLMGICIRYMRDDFAAKDVLQESFINIFKSIDKYKNTGSFEGWISKITVRCALQELRKNKSKVVYLDASKEMNELHINANVEVELNEEDILKMIDLLPEHYRVIFNMYIIEGYSHQEIGKLLGIGESTSRTKLTRARKKIALIYQERMNMSEKSQIKIKS